VLPDEKSFRFYTGINNPTGEISKSLKDFMNDIKKVNINSIEFHNMRGDFSNWISDSLKDNILANNLNKLKNFKGEKLRDQIIKTVGDRYKALSESLIPPKPKKKKIVRKKVKKKPKKKKSKKSRKKKPKKKK
jgi:hypothetical protein